MNFDFESVRDYMQQELRKKASWANILFFSTNNRIIDTVADAISQFALYDDYLTRNTRWDLATEKSALTTQSQFLGYQAERKVGATGNLRVSTDESFDATYGTNVVFPKYTVFSDGGNIQFASTQVETLLTTDKYIDIPVVQGVPKSFTYVAQGNDYEEIIINNSSIENNVYEVEVNGVDWTEIDDLNLAEENSEVYQLENKVNFDGVILTFGNGVFGKKLTEGDVVVFRYIETLGLTGNITSTNIVTTVEDTIYDTNDNQVEVYCTNLANLDGGDEEEDIEDIRSNGTNTFQAGEKAVTQRDYKIIIERSPNVLQAVVWGAFEYNKDRNQDIWTWIDTQENVVNVSAFTPAGEQLTEAQQVEIIEDIKEVKPPTDIVRFTDVNFIYLAWHIDIYVEDESFVLSQVKSDVINGVQTEYGLNSIGFFEHLYETEWKGYINTISGVDYHVSYIEVIKYDSFDSLTSSTYNSDIELDIYSIEPGSVKVYVRDDTATTPTWELIGVDDGQGGFVAESPYNLTGSSINYTTGEGSLFVVSGLTGNYEDFSLKYYYQRDGQNLCLNQRNQIFKIEEITDVTAQYAEDSTCSG